MSVIQGRYREKIPKPKMSASSLDFIRNFTWHAGSKRSSRQARSCCTHSKCHDGQRYPSFPKAPSISPVCPTWTWYTHPEAPFHIASSFGRVGRPTCGDNLPREYLSGSRIAMYTKKKVVHVSVMYRIRTALTLYLQRWECGAEFAQTPDWFHIVFAFRYPVIVAVRIHQIHKTKVCDLFVR